MDKANPFSLIGKTILITGASSGIGKECAITCSNIGASIVLLGRDKARLTNTLSLLNDKVKHQYFSFDLTDEKEIREFVDKIKKQGILLNGIVHSAGISTTLPLRLLTPEKQLLFFKTNVIGGLHLTVELSKKNGGLVNGASIVFIASVMSHVGEVGKTLYAMTKGALVSSAKSMAIELAPRNIRVNTLSPGVVKTPMSSKSAYSQNNESLSKIISKHPLGLGEANDIANACVYLLSEASKWTTGTNLIIDGGYTAK